jgi:hypothetical protein
LAKYGILKLFDSLYEKKGIVAVNYFLSMYKGENTAMLLYSDKDNSNQLRNFIKKSFNTFFSDYLFEYKEEQLPVNRLFLNIKPNTLYFWDQDPFAERTIFNNRKKQDLQLNSTLSYLCLRELSITENLESEEIYNLYFRLLLIFRKVIEEWKSGQFIQFVSDLIQRMKDLKPESFQQIIQLEDWAQNQFLKNKKKYNHLFISDDNTNRLYDQKMGNGTISEEWIILLNDAFQIHRQELSESTLAFMARMFILISQKISLRLDRLIVSAVMAREINQLA